MSSAASSQVSLPPAYLVGYGVVSADSGSAPGAHRESLGIECLAENPPSPAYPFPGPAPARNHMLDGRGDSHAHGQSQPQSHARFLLNPSDHSSTEAVIDSEMHPRRVGGDHDSRSEDTEVDGQSFDDYDWDNDDDLEGDVRFDESGPTRQEPRRAHARRSSPYSLAKFVLSTFIGNLLLAVIFILPPLIYRYAGFYPTENDPRAPSHRLVYENMSAWLFWLSFNLVASWAIHFLVELLPRIIVLIIGVIWGDVSESVKTAVETFLSARVWLKTLLISGMVWGSWQVVFAMIYRLHSPSGNTHSRAPYTQGVHVAVVLLFFLSLILCLEKLLLLSISINFHRVAYSERIQKVTHALAVIDTLQDYRPKRPKAFHNRQASAEILSNLRFPSGGATTTPKKGGATPYPPIGPPSKRWWWQPATKGTRPVHENEMADTPTSTPEKNHITSLPADRPTRSSSPPSGPGSRAEEWHKVSTEPHSDELINPSFGHHRNNSDAALTAVFKRGTSAAQIARDAMKDPVSVLGKKSGLRLDINNPTEARKLARRIFSSFRADPSRKYLIPSDFYPAFPNPEAAERAFSIFDSDGNGDISRTEVKNEIFRAYKERRALTQSLHDVGNVIGKLDGLLMALGSIIFIFIALDVVGIDFSKALTSIYTVGIAAAFIFKETAGNVFDAIVMVFCTHPFDTGDRIIMDNEGVEELLVVKRMGLLATVFARWDGTEWFAPNSLLGKKFIINLRRSNHQFENATVQIGWNTPFEKLSALEDNINHWLQTDEQRRFEPGTACVIQKLVNQQYMEVTFGMTHRENWQDWGGRWTRRTAFHAALNYYSHQLGISFYNAEQPILMQDWAGLREKLRDNGWQDETESDRDGDDELNSSSGDQVDNFIGQHTTPTLMVRSEKGSQELSDHHDDPVNFVQVGHDLGKLSPQAAATPFERMPEALGFSPPPQSGTGMRKRKRLSNRIAMAGDA